MTLDKIKTLYFEFLVTESCIKTRNVISDIRQKLMFEIDDQHQLKTILLLLSESYMNALDHGVLGLESFIKDSSTGFSDYFQLKESRLTQLECAHINIVICATIYKETYYWEIHVEDSGQGFDVYKALERTEDDSLPYHRGLLLIQRLCNRVMFSSSGNKISMYISQ